MSDLVKAISLETTRNFLSILLGAVISSIITIVWQGNLVSIILASMLASLIGGFIFFVFLGKYDWSKTVFMAFISAGFSAHLLSYITTFCLNYVYNDVPFSEPKMEFFLSNSFYNHSGLGTLILMLGSYFSMLWLYEYCRKKYYGL